jgi:hypothetical protein
METPSLSFEAFASLQGQISMLRRRIEAGRDSPRVMCLCKACLQVGFRPNRGGVLCCSSWLAQIDTFDDRAVFGRK